MLTLNVGTKVKEPADAESCDRAPTSEMLPKDTLTFSTLQPVNSCAKDSAGVDSRCLARRTMDPVPCLAARHSERVETFLLQTSICAHEDATNKTIKRHLGRSTRVNPRLRTSNCYCQTSQHPSPPARRLRFCLLANIVFMVCKSESPTGFGIKCVYSSKREMIRLARVHVFVGIVVGANAMSRPSSKALGVEYRAQT